MYAPHRRVQIVDTWFDITGQVSVAPYSNDGTQVGHAHYPEMFETNSQLHRHNLRL